MPSSNKLIPGFDPILQHPPERGERKKKYVVLYSCCCCCCCCLHTLGGAIGAVVAGNYCAEPDELDEWEESPTLAKRMPGSQWIYWSSFLAVTVVGSVLIGLLNSAHLDDSLLIIGLSLLLLGPVWMLGASGVAALQIAFRRDLPSKKAGYWRQLGKITGGMIAGSVLGVLAMVLIGVVLMNMGGR